MSDEGRDFVVKIWNSAVLGDLNEAEPDVHGVITLTEEQREDLDHRLYRVMGEDFIFAYSIGRFEVPGRLTEGDIFAAIIEPRDDADAAEAAEIWGAKTT